MLVIRNSTELQRHIDRYKAVNAETHPALVQEATRRARAALDRWNQGTPAQHAAVNDIFGPPPS